jgi:hypothetical protein
MARPGMTEGTSNDAAPEAVRLDLDPGRNVGTAELAAGPPSYRGPERTTERPWPAIGLAAIVVAVIAAAIVFYWV